MQLSLLFALPCLTHAGKRALSQDQKLNNKRRKIEAPYVYHDWEETPQPEVPDKDFSSFTEQIPELHDSLIKHGFEKMNRIIDEHKKKKDLIFHGTHAMDVDHEVKPEKIKKMVKKYKKKPKNRYQYTRRQKKKDNSLWA